MGLGLSVRQKLVLIMPDSSSESIRFSAGMSNSSLRQVRHVSRSMGKSLYFETAASNFWDLSLFIQSGVRSAGLFFTSNRALPEFSRNRAPKNPEPSRLYFNKFSRFLPFTRDRSSSPDRSWGNCRTMQSFPAYISSLCP